METTLYRCVAPKRCCDRHRAAFVEALRSAEHVRRG